MKDDTISRQAAIDEIEYEIEMINSALDSITLDFNAREILQQRRGEAREILNSIQQLPSVQTYPEWIPIEKEMPNNGDTVLITHSQGVTKAWWDGRHWANGMTKNFKTVLAWMPLPKPYKKENKGDKNA